MIYRRPIGRKQNSPLKIGPPPCRKPRSRSAVGISGRAPCVRPSFLFSSCLRRRVWVRSPPQDGRPLPVRGKIDEAAPPRGSASHNRNAGDGWPGRHNCRGGRKHLREYARCRLARKIRCLEQLRLWPGWSAWQGAGERAVRTKLDGDGFGPWHIRRINYIAVSCGRATNSLQPRSTSAR